MPSMKPWTKRTRSTNDDDDDLDIDVVFLVSIDEIDDAAASG